MACLGSVARAITGVAGGSTRAALTLHFAKRNNAADISAKEGTRVGTFHAVAASQSQDVSEFVVARLLTVLCTRKCVASLRGICQLV